MITEIRQRLALTDKRDDLRLLHFALGKLLDDASEYQQAWDHFSAGNACMENSADIEKLERWGRKLRRIYDGSLAGTYRHESPVFIVGMPRSGSSLVEQTLAAHPQLKAVGEVDHMLRLERRVRSKLADESLLISVGNEYLQKIGLPEGQRVVDKQLANFSILGFIKRLFPEAKFIHCRRHPLDTILSCYLQNFGNQGAYFFSLDSAVGYYHFYRRMMAFWEDLFPGQILDLPYEHFVDSPEAMTRKLLAHCDLPWHEDCLNPAGVNRSVKTASAWQVRQPVYKRSVQRYKNYENQLAEVKAQLTEYL